MYSIHYSVTAEDYLAFNEHHLKNTAAGKKALWTLRGMIVALTLFVIFIFIIAGAELQLILTEAIVLSVLCVVLCVFAQKLMRSSLRRRIRKMEKKDQRLFSPKGTITFDAEKITDAGEKMELKTYYSAIEQVFLAKTAFYFYFSPAQAYVLPYHNFKGQEELDRFYAWLQTVIDESKIRREK